MGAGKSTVGPQLASELGWNFMDLDDEIVRAERNSIAAIFETVGELRFRQLEHRELTRVLKLDTLVLALGGGAIESAENLQLLKGDAETVLIYLEAPFDVLLARCEGQQLSQPTTARRPVLDRKHELMARFERRTPLYELAHWKVPTAGQNASQIAQMIVSKWKEHATTPL